MTKANLIDRYVAAVGRHLPASTRNDVQLELRTALYDAMEERGLDAEKDEQGVIALLKEYGPPEKMAVSYGTQRHLIGPLLYPHYLTVLRIVGIVITVINLVGLALGVFQSSAIGEAITNSFGNYIGSLFTAFGIVTFVFAILERNGPDFKIDEEGEDWDPRELPGLVEDYDRPDIPTIVAELFFLTAFIGLIRATPSWVPPDLPEPINFFPELISRLVPFFGWFQLLWAGEFALKFAVLIRGRWNRTTRIIEVVLAFVGLAVSVLVTQSIAATLPSNISGMDELIVVSLGVTVVIIMVDAFVKLYRLFRPPTERGSFQQLAGLSKLSKLSKLSELSNLSRIQKRRGRKQDQ